LRGSDENSPKVAENGDDQKKAKKRRKKKKAKTAPSIS